MSSIIRTLVALTLMAVSHHAAAQLEWPQEIQGEKGTVVVYQPQPEKLSGNTLSGRAALSIEMKDSSEPIFGVMWFTAKLDTDSDQGIATVRSLKVDDVSWPESKDAAEQQLTAVLEGSVPETGFVISMERLSASLESAEIEQQSLQQLKTDPPEIIFREQLAVLMLFDGEPRFKDVDNSDWQRALNVPFAVACKKRGNECWLSSGTFWYTAKSATGPWSAAGQPPKDLAQMIPKADDEAQQGAPSSPPEIVVATRPTELIVTDGKPEWTSLSGGELLYVQNTESPWLRELSTGNMYLLLSGRWYRAKETTGPWTFVRADELPASFADIPPASDIGGLRSSVAGTQEAEDAVRDAAIPQTSAIKRSEAKLTVEYDGKPKFEKIKGTDVAYAVNTGAQVLLIHKKYYAVDNAVWFVSEQPTGPWVVADEIPDEEIAKIPPSSPVYNTTYVQVYESTPEVVYVGYRPGYMWSFPYYGVPVYGTGWYYPPYWGGIYYPRPPTWGFHVGYNPWTGWNFGLSWSNGFFSIGVGWGGGWGGSYRPWGCCGGWYGGGYRRPVVINTGDINIGNNVNIGNRTEIGNKINSDNRISDRVNKGDNLYQRDNNRARNADRATAQRNFKEARPAANRENNVFADRNGQVARRDGDNWQTRQDGQWKNSAPASSGSRDLNRDHSSRDVQRPQHNTRQASPSHRQSMNYNDLNRSHQARSHGRSREMSRSSHRARGGRRH